MALARIVRQQGRRALAVDGVVQSIEVVAGEITPGYWPEMLPPRVGPRALLLGLGGGTIARLLMELRPDVEILAVDDDSAVLQCARRSTRFRLDDPRVCLRLGDALAITRELAKAGERFDFIAVDLFRGANLERGAVARPFVVRIGKLLAEDGWASFNLIRDRRTARRLRRLGQHLRIRETRLIGLNCVVHCQRLSDE